MGRGPRESFNQRRTRSAMDDKRPTSVDHEMKFVPFEEYIRHKHRILLPEIFRAITDVTGYNAGLQRLGRELATQASARSRRFYYEEILGRSPEDAVFALDPIDDPAECIRYLLCSDEFMSEHDIILQREFPNLTREFFLHVPKSGGTTILQAFGSDRRFCLLYLFPGFDNGWFEDRLHYLRTAVSRLLHQEAQYVVVGGHLTAQRIITHHLKRGWDSAFATVRDPIESSVSWVNYVLTLLATDPNHPDVAAWRSILEIPPKREFTDRRAALDLAPRIIDRLVPSNAICTALGRTPDFISAVDTATVLDVKMIRIEQIGDFLRSRGITRFESRNVSHKHVAWSDLDHKTRSMLYDKNSEDLKFYDWVTRHTTQGARF